MINQLTSEIRSHSRCTRCDNILNASLFKGKVIALKISVKGRKFYCVRCMQNVSGKFHKTDEDLDMFVNSLVCA